MKITIRNSSIYNINAVTAFLIFLLLEFIYYSYIIEFYSSDGYRFEFNLVKYIETKVLFIAGLGIIYWKKPGPFIYACLYVILLLLFIPNLILYEFMESSIFIVYPILLLIILILYLKIETFTKLSIKITDRRKVFILFVLALILLIPIIMQFKARINLNVFLFKDIYEIRETNRIDSFLVGYSYNWLGKVLCPVLFVIGLIKKNKFIIGFSVIVMLYLFAVAAHKSVFLSIFAVLFFLWGSHKQKVLLFNILILASSIIGLLVFLLFDYHYLISILTRRVFFDPALGNIHYFSFFESNPLYYSNSYFSSIISYPYSITPEEIISKFYFDMPTGSANNGLISDGYMSLGIPGVFINIFLFAVLIKLFDNVHSENQYFGIFIITIYIFISSFFFTCLMTHGVLLLLIVLIFLKKNNKSCAEYPE